MRILIVDDSPINLMVLKGIIGKFDGISVSTFADPLMALAACQESQFDVVVADYMMPGIDGIGLIQHLRALEGYADLPIIMITTADEKRTCIGALEAGATDFITKPIEPVELKARLRNLIQVRLAQLVAADRAAWLTHQIDAAATLLQAREREMMTRLNRVIDERDWEAAGVIDRTAEIGRLVARGLGLDDETSRDLRLAVTLHASGALDLRETAPSPAAAVSDSLTPVRMARTIAQSRHERWDGTGLPAGLRGAEIPVEARIAAIADTFVALCTDRAYGRAMGTDEARRRVAALAGTHFDPDCVRVLDRSWADITALISPAQTPLRVA